MEEKVIAFIKENQMIQPGDRIILGLSGGADSVCLFFLLAELRQSLDFTLACVHVHHGLRGEEADGDEAFAARLCKERRIPYRCYYYNVKKEAEDRKLSTEEAGRLLRYRSFERALNELGYNKIAVAHHMMDQAETVLYHLCRGSGLAGLAGMRPVSGNRIRPLLCLKKEEITEYLLKRGISWREDHTNLEQIYTRNKIRHSVLPCLSENINPVAAEHIAACSFAVAEAAQYIEKQAAKAWESCAIDKKEEIAFDLERYQELDTVIKKQLIFMAADYLGLGRKDLQAVHLSMATGLIGAQAGREVCLPGGLRICREYGALVFTRKERQRAKLNGTALELAFGKAGEYALPDGSGSLSASAPVPVEQIPLKEIVKNEENTYTKWFDYDRIKGTLQLRNRREGDFLEISKERFRKKLKEYLIDSKVPRQQRDNIWLLADGSHILWVVGYRISEGYKIRRDTRRAVRIQMKWR